MLRADAVKFIRETEGRIFSVEFIKRTTKELRRMVARTGVKSHLRGGEAAYSFSEKALISVFDMQANGYRSIPIEGIVRIKIDGEWEDVTDAVTV